MTWTNNPTGIKKIQKKPWLLQTIPNAQIQNAQHSYMTTISPLKLELINAFFAARKNFHQNNWPKPKRPQ